MRNRRTNLLAAAIVAALGGVILWAMTRPSPVPDPVYNGHPLSYWLRSEIPNDLVLDSNAVPYLVRGLKPDSPARKAYDRLWPHLPGWLRFHLPTPVGPGLVRESSCILLAHAGTNAKPAIPDLIRVMREENDMTRVMAALALGKIARSEDTNAIQALVAMTKDPDTNFEAIAEAALTTADPQAAAKAGITNTAP